MERHHEPPDTAVYRVRRSSTAETAQHQLHRYALTLLYCLVLAASVLGNALTCLVILADRAMRTRANCYLFNLAVADALFVAIVVACKLLDAYLPYRFSDCYLINCGAELMGEVSAMTITGLSIERYQAISDPFGTARSNGTNRRVVAYILAMWLVAAASAYLQSTQLYVVESRTSELRPACVFDAPTILREILPTTLLFFVAPLLVLSVVYASIGRILLRAGAERRRFGLRAVGKSERSLRKSLRVSVAVLVAFFVCFTPYHLQRLALIYQYLAASELELLAYLEEIGAPAVRVPTMLLYLLSGVVNPLIYNVVSHKFRRAFKKVLIGERATAATSSAKRRRNEF